MAFISIENTVKIFGAAGRAAWGVGEGRNRDALLSHFCLRCCSPRCAWRGGLFTALTRCCRGRESQALSSFSFLSPPNVPRPGGGRWRARGDRVQAGCSGPPGTRSPVLSRSLYHSSNCVLSRRLQESLLVEVDGVGEAGLHLWYLVTDDLHQHFRELHLQRLRLAKGVEAEVQQVPHELHDTQTHHLCCAFTIQTSC